MNQQAAGPQQQVQAQALVQPPAAVAPPQQTALSRLYAQWTLDSVIEAAVAVAHDSTKRPRLYRTVPANQIAALASLRARLGTDPDWPNAVQRAAICAPLLGPSDSKHADKAGPFHQGAAALRDAAAAYSERVYDTGEPMLRQAFIDAATTFAAQLATLGGNAAGEGERQVAAIFNAARAVLTNQEVAQAFALPQPQSAGWPTANGGDGDGAALMEEITRVLAPAAGTPTSSQHFTVLQRIAYWGALTVAAVQAGWHQNQQVNQLLVYAYSWATALRATAK